MAEVKNERHSKEPVVADRTQDFWTRYSRPIMIGLGAIVLLVGGWAAYKYLVVAPKEEKANEAIWRAQQHFELDSMQKALKGDGQAAGFEKVASQYSGTDAGNLAHFYAGAAALRSGDNATAVKHLKEFSTSAKQIQARAYKLLGDAYAAQNKTADALSSYTKAGHEFEKDKTLSAQYLFLAAYYADRVANKKDEAKKLYSELATDYSNTAQGTEAKKFLAQLGVYGEE